MMNNDKTILTFEQNDMKFISEMPWDVNMDEILKSFYGLCVSATFPPKMILECMKVFADENLKTFYSD